MRVVLAGQDPDATGRMILRAVILDREGRGVRVTHVPVPQAAERRVSLGRLRPGRYRLVLELRDRAGNVARVSRALLVRPIRRSPAGSARRARPTRSRRFPRVPESPPAPPSVTVPGTGGEAPLPPEPAAPPA